MVMNYLKARGIIKFLYTLTPYEEVSLVSKLPQFEHLILKNLFLTSLVISCIIVFFSSHEDPI